MLCTVLVYAIPAAGALVGVVAGYQNQDFGMTLKCVVSSTLLSLAVCVNCELNTCLGLRSLVALLLKKPNQVESYKV